MGKDTKLDVRIHSQEREWLLNLGGGNIVEGVRHLIEDLKDKRAGADGYSYTTKNKHGKFLKWRDN